VTYILRLCDFALVLIYLKSLTKHTMQHFFVQVRNICFTGRWHLVLLDILWC